MPGDVPVKKLILIPAIITLAVTLLRLAGELMHWSATLFNAQAGGGGALVGIAWLVPVFGIYFAVKLLGMGHRPPAVGPAIGYALLGFAIMPVVGIGAVTALGLAPQSNAAFGLFIVLALVGGVFAFRGWPDLGRTLLAYGLAARIPVVLVMLFAILGNWGTHYDVPPNPEFPAMSPLAKWFMIGVLPQLTIWIWFTLAVGAVFGSIPAAVKGRAKGAATA